MPVTLTKAQLNKLLVAERAKSRTKQQRRVFMSRTLSIYNGQKKRLADALEEQRADPDAHPYALPSHLPYTLDELRLRIDAALLAGKCRYCLCKLTIKRLTPDHKNSLASGGSWNISNLAMCCQSCNWQKGRMSDVEFKRLLRFCQKYLTVDSATDLKKRLSLGGKWSPR